MGTSYPDRTNTRGVWKLSEIYKNKITHGTWKGSSAGGSQIGLASGGSTGSDVNTIQSISQAGIGNAVDFGDLTAAAAETTPAGNGIRALFAGVGTDINKKSDLLTVSFNVCNDFDGSLS